MTRNGGQLAGTISGAYISPSDPGGVQILHSSFTGIASGSSVTLTVGGGLFGATNVTGTMSGSTLMLSLPVGGGELTNLTFYAASVGTYNQAVTALDRSAAATYQKEQRQQADQAVVHAASTLTRDLGALAQDATFKSQLAAMSRALARTKAALEKTQQKAQEIEALAQAHPNGDSGTVCSDAESDVGTDAESDVGTDAESDVGTDAESDVGTEIQTVQGDIVTVQHDLTALESAEAKTPSYHPAGTPSASTVQQAISNAQASIQAAVSTANSDISTANGYVAAAYQAADQAIAAGHCGGGLGTPPTVAPISANSG